MQFKNHYNSIPDQGQTNDEPSQTIPDQSMTVREIMTRYAQGLGYTGPKVSSYDNGRDPLSGLNIDTLDLSERFDMIERVKNHIQDLKDSTYVKQPSPPSPQAPQATMETNNPDNKQPAPVEQNKPL